MKLMSVPLIQLGGCVKLGIKCNVNPLDSSERLREIPRGSIQLDIENSTEISIEFYSASHWGRNSIALLIFQ